VIRPNPYLAPDHASEGKGDRALEKTASGRAGAQGAGDGIKLVIIHVVPHFS